MAVESFYFTHDYNSRNDPKMVALRMKEGMEGIGIFWCIAELLYEEGGFVMLSECERIAFDLRVKEEKITRIIENYQLFRHDGVKFWSETVLRRLDARNAKSRKARESAIERWKRRNPDANALHTQNEGNAIKERKGEERKGEERKGEESPAFGDSKIQIFGLDEKQPSVIVTSKYVHDRPARICGVDGIRAYMEANAVTAIYSDAELNDFLEARNGAIFDDGAKHLINAINRHRNTKPGQARKLAFEL